MKFISSQIHLPSDPNVEVIYISPVSMKKELKEYYHRLIDMAARVNNLDADDMKSRLKFITPIHHDRFPVSSLLTSIIKLIVLELVPWSVCGYHIVFRWPPPLISLLA